MEKIEINTALSSIEAKYGFHFKEKQLSAIKSIVEGNDTFVVLPTGYGKSKLVKKQKGTVLVISPLQSLMLDQISKHNERDIPVLYNSVPLPA